MHEINVGYDVIKENAKMAEKIKEILGEKGIKSFNIMGAIGSGKSSLIEKIVKRFKNFKFCIIAGDVVSEIDEKRLKRLQIPVVGISTGKECHLDAHMVFHALEKVDLSADVLLIENVGNLICPADFDLGEDVRVVVVSTSEGDDIIYKHPMIFKLADWVVINKCDIKDYVGASPEKMRENVLSLNPKAKVFLTSTKTGYGMEEFFKEFERCVTG